VVTAGPYEPTRVGALVAGDLPFWADVPGDPFAEAQARNAVEAGDALPGQASTVLGALARADAFSVCSTPQRHALLGQLGLLGRLSASPPGFPWASVLPPAWDAAGLPEAPPRTRSPGSPLSVALFGGWNNWVDTDTLAQGLLRAMERGADVRVQVFGGAVPGHAETGFRRFQDVRTGPFGGRFTFWGWVPHAELGARLSEAHVTINADIRGAEPERGSRTRLLVALHQGLEVITTPETELARDLARDGFVRSFPTGDANRLADMLVRVASEGPEGWRQDRSVLRDRYRPTVIARPLLAWVRDPVRAPLTPSASDRLATENAGLRYELNQVHRSLTWRTLSPLHAWLRRLRQS